MSVTPPTSQSSMGSGVPFLQSTIEQSHAPVGSAVRQLSTAVLKSLALVNCEAPAVHHARVATPNATTARAVDRRGDQCLRFRARVAAVSLGVALSLVVVVGGVGIAFNRPRK